MLPIRAEIFLSGQDGKKERVEEVIKESEKVSLHFHFSLCAYSILSLSIQYDAGNIVWKKESRMTLRNDETCLVTSF